jgi:glycosyltransferase involved in cell wall biosynthesis
MQVALVALGIISLLELVMWLPPLWRWHEYAAIILIVPLALASGLLVGERPTLWSFGILYVSLYRLINLLRVIEQRPHVDFLNRTGRRTSLLLISGQVMIIGVWALEQHWHLAISWWLSALVAGQLAGAVMLVTSTQRHLRTTHVSPLKQRYADRDLPTLTVAIPARNETDDLEACLNSLVSSNYPKLEILVLDDCSQLKRTPEIIRSFAHDGVRFISGQAPPERWLAKNYAYKQLAEASGGKIVLFCGVDVRFQPGTLRALVDVLLQKNKRVISLAPKNQLPDSRGLDELFPQPDRYAWELALPRRFLNRPPVLSTCWLAYRETLDQAGGFGAVSQSISPESYFAKWAVLHDDSYSFLRSDSEVGLTCSKSLSEQRATAIRTRYPQLHRRPELVGAVSLLELGWLTLPFAMVIIGAVTGHWLVMAVSLINCIFLVIFYAKVINFTYQKRGWVGGWLLPFAGIYDVAVLNYSMWRYEFNEVVWKDRNVCIPVMRVIPSLPKQS